MDKDVEYTAKGIKKASAGEPITDITDIDRLKAYFSSKGKKGKLTKYYVYLITGLNTALRVSDIVALRVRDVKDGRINNVIQRKTRNSKNPSKTRNHAINDTLREVLEKWIEQEKLQEDDFIFYSNMSNNGKEGDARQEYNRSTKHIDKSVVYKVFAKAVKELGLKVHYSNHCLRKTFAYHLYKKTNDLGLVQAILGHSSSSVTLRYIGVTQQGIDETYKNFSL